MTENQQLNAGIQPTQDDITSQVVEQSQNTSEPDDIPCEDSNLAGHTQWSCNKCRERLDRDFDEAVRESMLTYQGWTEKQIDALGSFRRFDKTPWTDVIPDPSQPEPIQLRTWSWNCVKELQARMDAARDFHETMTAQHHLQNDESKFKLAPSSTDAVACKDDNGNELHPQWTCHHCLTRLNDQWDKLLREAMFDQGWTEAQIDAAGSLRQFDKKPWSEMTPDSSQPQLAQVRAWGSNRLRELEARMDNARNLYKAMIETEGAANKTSRN